MKASVRSRGAGFLLGECAPLEEDQHMPVEEQTLIDEKLQAVKTMVLTIDLENPGQLQELIEKYRVPVEGHDAAIDLIRAMQGGDGAVPLDWVEEIGMTISAGGSLDIVAFEISADSMRKIVSGVGAGFSGGGCLRSGATLKAKKDLMVGGQATDFQLTIASFVVGTIHVDFYVKGTKVGAITDVCFGGGLLVTGGIANWYSRL
jgi:hypothetical protein